mmetsp:Transcript_147583/g.269146  ORF Transcript_147583/g.269146 Transcript_147583/m.269146 type:complete len:269 (+) Transcript_147583:2-808(+)
MSLCLGLVMRMIALVLTFLAVRSYGRRLRNMEDSSYQRRHRLQNVVENTPNWHPCRGLFEGHIGVFSLLQSSAMLLSFNAAAASQVAGARQGSGHVVRSPTGRQASSSAGNHTNQIDRLPGISTSRAEVKCFLLIKVGLRKGSLPYMCYDSFDDLLEDDECIVTRMRTDDGAQNYVTVNLQSALECYLGQEQVAELRKLDAFEDEHRNAMEDLLGIRGTQRLSFQEYLLNKMTSGRTGKKLSIRPNSAQVSLGSGMRPHYDGGGLHGQ